MCYLSPLEKIGCTSEKSKNIWFFARFALPLQPNISITTNKNMKTDIQIARECELKPIGEIAEQLGIEPEKIEPYGRYMAKVPVNLIDGQKVKKKQESLRATFTDDDGAIAHYPVCIAKTQFSFSADSTRYGSPEGFTIRIRDVILNCGSEMIVAIAGDMVRMPGLPKSPQAERITIENGEIEGLS